MRIRSFPTRDPLQIDSIETTLGHHNKTNKQKKKRVIYNFCVTTVVYYNMFTIYGSVGLDDCIVPVFEGHFRYANRLRYRLDKDDGFPLILAYLTLHPNAIDLRFITDPDDVSNFPIDAETSAGCETSDFRSLLPGLMILHHQSSKPCSRDIVIDLF